MFKSDKSGRMAGVLRCLAVSLLLWPVWLTAQQAELSARLDRTDMIVGETVNLIIELRGSARAPDADLSVLDEQFVVLNTNTQTQVNISNGQRQALAQLQVILQPTRTGELTIPPITVGNQQTRPLRLNVRSAPEPEPGQARDLVLEVDAEPKTPYVQAQVTVTARLLIGVALSEATLNELEIDNAQVQRLGEDVQYNSQRNGRNYRVIERRYAVFPQRSGPLEIPPLQFSGRVGGNWRNPGRAVNQRSNPLTLDVQPVPAEYTGAHWLPAAALQLQEAGLDQSAEYRVGEPLTRTIDVQALGLPDEMLPDIEPPTPYGARVYADQPAAQTDVRDQWVISQRVIKQAIVPTTAGTLELPEVRLQWWDTVNNRQSEATLPATTIEVLPALNGTTPQLLAPAPAPAPAGEPAAQTPVSTVVDPGIWPYLSAGFAALWVLTLIAWWRGRVHKPATKQSVEHSEQQSLNAKAARKACQQACSNNNTHAAASAVVAWANASWPDNNVNNLGQVMTHLEEGALRQALKDLERACYGRNAGEWQGALLWQAISKGLPGMQAGGKDQSKDEVLPELYATTR